MAAQAEPIWSSDTDVDCVPLKKICNGSMTEIAKNLSNEWAWHGSPKRLGRRFESLLTALFEQSEHVKLLGHGIVVKDQKQTIGELDYIIKLPDRISILKLRLSSTQGSEARSIERTGCLGRPELPGPFGSQDQPPEKPSITLSQTALGQQSI